MTEDNENDELLTLLKPAVDKLEKDGVPYMFVIDCHKGRAIFCGIESCKNSRLRDAALAVISCILGTNKPSSH